MQVKFRGKRVDGCGWVEGDLMWHKRFIELKPYIKSTQTGQMEWIEVEPSSIGMFTGLTDKNGKEIYGAVGERGGDVLRICNGSINFYPMMDKDRHIIFKSKGFNLPYWAWNENGEGNMDSTHWVETIGNAFDNPELLEK